jgi:hypothetical protein
MRKGETTYDLVAKEAIYDLAAKDDGIKSQKMTYT